MVSPLPARIGPHELVRELGRGGMGLVFLARDPAGRDVALKTVLTFDRHGLERFRREAEALAALDHPVIVQARRMTGRPLTRGSAPRGP